MEENIKLYNLDNLISMIGSEPESVKEFVHLFLDTSSQTMIQLNEAFEAQNYTQMGALAHKLKSSIDLMGIESLKKEIRTVEIIGKDQNNLQKLDDLIPKLNRILEEVYKQMQAEIE
ncbi:MAG: Hpt domain-containing protein [Bacteroidetes bacterium]|nr:Hpt domain-containing protein [Bacteroidota bacterium]